MKKITLLIMASMISSFIWASLTDGLVGYWPFDGDAKDYSGNGNHGTTHNVSLTHDRHGNASNAYYFGGYYNNGFKNAGYISVPNSSSLHNIGHSFTIAAWIYINDWCLNNGCGNEVDLDYWASIVCKGYSSRQYSLQIQANNAQNWFVATESLVAVHSIPSSGAWHHVAITDNGKNLIAYIDGNIKASSGIGASISKNSEALYFGMDNPGNLEYFNGILDEIVIYNRALSSSEIHALYNGNLKVCTVSFDRNGGDGSMGEQKKLSGTHLSLPSNAFTNEGNLFQGWALSADSEVVYADGAEIFVDHDMTLYAVWSNPVLTLSAESANWSEGSITLLCADADTSGAAHDYTLQYYDESLNDWVDVDVGDMAVTTGMVAGYKRLTDKRYCWRLDGITPVTYRVHDKNCRASLPCQTRRRFGLAVGYTNLDYASSLPEANLFWNLYGQAGGIVNASDSVVLSDGNADTKGLKKEFARFAELVQPGDVFVFFVATHGEAFFEGSINGFQTSKYGWYSISELKESLDAIGSQDVAVVSILSTCGSGYIAQACGTDNNKAWITATTGKETSTGFYMDTPYMDAEEQYSMFSREFLEYGWQAGGAGRSSTLTFKDLAVHARANIYGLYSEGRKARPNYLNENLLEKIKATNGSSPVVTAPPAAAQNVIVQDKGEGRYEILWNPVSGAKYYYVLRRESGATTWDWMYVGRRTAVSLPEQDDGKNIFVLKTGTQYEFCIEAHNEVGGTQCAVVEYATELPAQGAIPEVADDSDVKSAFAGFGDEANLQKNITTKSEYDAYRIWAGDHADAVRVSLYSWTAFALDALGMLDRKDPFVKDDIEIDAIKTAGTDGGLTMEVGLKDVAVGNAAEAARLTKVFGIEGAATLDETQFASDNVTLERCEPKDGKVQLIAKPTEEAKGDGSAFFMRVRVK